MNRHAHSVVTIKTKHKEIVQILINSVNILYGIKCKSVYYKYLFIYNIINHENKSKEDIQLKKIY